MRWFRPRRPALLITPKILLLKQGRVCIPLGSLKELSQYGLSGIDVYFDGFSQSFISGALPLVGFFDRRSAVYHKLARDFSKSTVFGGKFLKEGNALHYQGYGFDETINLADYLQELVELNIPIVSVQSLVFSSASTLFPFCISQIGSHSLLWISPYLGSGYRLVFYHENTIKFVRPITVHREDPTWGTKDLLQTLTYIQNEYNIDKSDLAVFLTFFTPDQLKVLKFIIQSEKVYQWDVHSNASQQSSSVAMESWLLVYIKNSKKFFTRYLSQSLLTPIIQQTKWIERGVFALKTLCVVLGVLIASSTINLWRLKSQLTVAQRVLAKKEEQIILCTKKLKMPSNVEILKFYAYLTSQKYPAYEQDPFALIATVAEQLPPDILVREVLWQKEPKNTLKLALRFANSAEEDKEEILNVFKENLLESLKQKSKVNITMNQSSAETMEINLS